MKHKAKLALLIVPLICLTLVGCMKSHELRDRILIQAIGIDKAEHGYRFTLQAFISEVSSGQIGVDASKSNIKMITVYGETISEALANVALVQGKEPFYGQNKYIAIGREVAKDGVSGILAFFNSNNQSRAGTDVVMADGEASELVSLHLVENLTSALSVRRMLENDHTHGKLDRSTLMDIISAADSGIDSMSLPILVPVERESELDNFIYCKGTALFRNGKYVGELDSFQTRGVMWVTDRLDSSVVAFVDDGSVNAAAVRVHRLISDIDAELTQGVPHFHITVTASGSLTELSLTDHGSATPDDIAAIEQHVEEYLAHEIENAYYASAKRHGCDLFRLSIWLKKHLPDYWRANSGRWNDILPLTECDADVQLTINRFDLQN